MHDELRATFNAMENAKLEDWQIIAAAHGPYQDDLANRVLSHLRLLEGDHGGFPIDRFQHSLQTATRAYGDGRDEDYVVCALLHDIGDTLASANHPDLAAAILKPYVSEDLHWMVTNHGIFQGYYFFEHLGLDRNMREAFRGHPNFEMTAEFCALYDQAAFDPHYDTLPLTVFEPMVQRVFSNVKRSIYLDPSSVGAG
ncbi:putative HD phosphohydrolase [Brevundimonas vesicularis]|uniref:HD domain-containing protein n=1 Tax=Brevundimonas vesicularis TaxID=41276 RepID=UPI0018EC5843|nr:HD domain-containing protein [Brevundimonas vesicularis]MDQ1193848.1 putative HD phosphohydrolase [Brevundimonas vesicularis]